MDAARTVARMREESLGTATPEQVVILLYDRLVTDIERGQEALEQGDRQAANELLQHAQDIVDELRVSLDVSVWDGAAGLAALYDYLAVTLVRANVSGDPQLAQACRGVAAPLRDAWHEAAAQRPASPAGPGRTGSAGAGLSGDLGVG